MTDDSPPVAGMETTVEERRLWAIANPPEWAVSRLLRDFARLEAERDKARDALAASEAYTKRLRARHDECLRSNKIITEAMMKAQTDQLAIRDAAQVAADALAWTRDAESLQKDTWAKLEAALTRLAEAGIEPGGGK